MRLAGVRVGVIGGGIGGLATAIVLGRRGAHVRVFERAVARREGIALLLWSNATRILRTLGLGDAIRDHGEVIGTTCVRNPRGDTLSTLPIAEWGDAPTVAIRRPDLLAALRGALPTEVVERDRDFHSYSLEGSGAIASFADGDRAELDILIGADGIHSTVRRQLLRDGEPSPVGQRAWVGLVRDVGHLVPSGANTAVVGHGPRFWYAPLTRGDAFWFAIVDDRVPGAEAVPEVLRTFAAWPAPIRELVVASDPRDLVSTRLVHRAPSDKWGVGPVTLLGDAAHPSTPDLGQGACQAIESAFVLGEALDAAPDLHDGLRLYESRRMERTATISRLCWLTNVNTALKNPLLCGVRDAAMRVALRTIARNQLAWILRGPA